MCLVRCQVGKSCTSMQQGLLSKIFQRLYLFRERHNKVVYFQKKKMQRPKSAGLSVLDAAASRGHHRSLAAQASSMYGPRTNRLGNLAVHRVGTTGYHYMDKLNAVGGRPVPSHEMFRRYSTPMQGGIEAHKLQYGGG